jgi:hypothetical protein
MLLSAHPREKSAPSFASTSIHRLCTSPKVWVQWWGVALRWVLVKGDEFLSNQLRFGYGNMPSLSG